MVKIEQPDFTPAVKLFKTAGAEKDLDWGVETQNFVLWNSYNEKVRWSGGNKLFEESFTTEQESPDCNTRYCLMPLGTRRDDPILKYSTFDVRLLESINKLFQGDILVSKCDKPDHMLQVWGNLAV